MSNASVLIVDDEVGMRSFLTKTLQPYCALVEEASTASQAAIKLDETRFHVVILDNLMPGQTGIEWLVEQRQIGFFGEAILITAYADLETAMRWLEIRKRSGKLKIYCVAARCLIPMF